MVWVKGQSGNPAGRQGSKADSCKRIFWNDLHEVWKASGRDALERMVKSHPNQFVDIMARVLPKEEQRKEIQHQIEVTLREPDWLKAKQIDITPDKSET